MSIYDPVERTSFSLCWKYILLIPIESLLVAGVG